MFEFLDEPKFLDAYLNKKATIFTNINLPTITWEEVLDFVNKYKDERILNKRLPSQFAFCYNDAQRISNVNKLVKEVHSRFELQNEDPIVITCQLFGSTILENGQTLDKHFDTENNLFWQGKGKSHWKLYDSMENNQPFLDVILEENDMLYIPAKTFHAVKPLTPRFAFAILFGDKK